jgi:hypothetical protein
MMQRRIRLGSMLFVISLGAASLACGLPFRGGPTPPASPIPVSTEAAGELLDVWKSAVENSSNGEVSVVITEEQLTSYAAIKLAEQEEPPLRDPQVFLRDGKVQIYGTAQAGSLTAPAVIVLSATVTPEGQINLNIDQANFGSLPVPASLLEDLSTALDEGLTGRLGSQASGVKITNLLIADGQMTITGAVSR